MREDKVLERLEERSHCVSIPGICQKPSASLTCSNVSRDDKHLTLKDVTSID